MGMPPLLCLDLTFKLLTLLPVEQSHLRSAEDICWRSRVSIFRPMMGTITTLFLRAMVVVIVGIGGVMATATLLIHYATKNMGVGLCE